MPMRVWLRPNARAARQFEHLHGERCERDLSAGGCSRRIDRRHDLRANEFDGDSQSAQHAGGESLLLAQQAEQDVLGADVVVLQRPRLFLRELDHVPGRLGESLEHHASIACRTLRLRRDSRAAIAPGAARASLRIGALRAACGGQIGVGAADQLGGTVLRCECGETDLDRGRVRVVGERGLDCVEALARELDRRAGHHAKELVAAVADDQVIGAQVRADRADHPLQQRVTHANGRVRR